MENNNKERDKILTRPYFI